MSRGGKLHDMVSIQQAYIHCQFLSLPSEFLQTRDQEIFETDDPTDTMENYDVSADRHLAQSIKCFGELICHVSW